MVTRLTLVAGLCSCAAAFLGLSGAGDGVLTQAAPGHVERDVAAGCACARG